MYRLVQIALPPYTDYESLERKLTLAVECVSVRTRRFTFIYPIASSGRPLDLIKNRGHRTYPDGLHPSQIPASLPCVSHTCFQYLLRLALVCYELRLHDASILLLCSRFGYDGPITSYVQPKHRLGIFSRF